MASDPTVKKIQLTGGAAESFGGAGGGGEEGSPDGTRKRGRGKKSAAKTYKISSVTKEGGGGTSPGTMDQLAASRVPATEDAGPVVSLLPKSVEAAGPAKGGSGGGGAVAKPMKVVLAAAKKKKGKVILAAAKPATGSPAAAATPSKTRKVSHGARKIKVSMSGLSKKISRAKTIRKEAAEATVDQIKKALHKAGLIKADSKAPESILRQMYADFMMLKSRAL
jgi:hypothetical protein